MAKSRTTKIPHESDKVVQITTPTWFGSHLSMLDNSKTELIAKQNPQLVVCKDDLGFYVTSRSALDSGLADMNRADSTYRTKMNEQYNDILG